MKWHFLLGRGQHPVIVLDAMGLGHREKFAKALECNFNTLNWVRFEGKTFILEKGYQRIVRLIERRLKQSPLSLLKPIKKGDNLIQKLIKKTEKWQSLNLRQVSNEKLNSIIEQFLEDYADVTISFYTPFYFEEVIEKHLEKRLKTQLKINRKKVEEIIIKLANDFRPTPLIKEKEELLKIASEIVKKGARNRYPKSSPKDIKNLPLGHKVLFHQKKFRSLNTYLFHVSEYSLAKVFGRLKRILKSNPKKRLEKLQKERRKNILVQKRLESKLQLDKNTLKLLKAARKWIQFRNNRLFAIGQFQYHMKPIFSEWGRRHNLKYEDVIQLKREEIISGKFSKKDIEARKKGYVFYLLNGKVKILVGREAKKFINKFKSGFNAQKIIKDQPVYPGKVKGIVQQGNAYTFHKFKPGRILVTGMTVPEVTHKITKAKAIVTDEGGITCHAAIIAREFKIPTVIATKIATRVFKNGDKVEVDAAKGIIKKL